MTEELPTPESREELYLAKAAGESVEVPTPESRKELFLNAIAQGGGGGGTSNFNELENRPKFNGTEMTGDTNVTDTTYANFVGTDGVTAGAAGLVPAPATTDADKFLKSNGTWATAGGGGGDTVYSSVTTSNKNAGGAVYIGNLNSSQEEQPDPTSTDNHYRYFWALPYSNSDVPSVNSINILGWQPVHPNGNNNITIGKDSNIMNGNRWSIAIGGNASVQGSGHDNVAIGTYAGVGSFNYSVGLGAYAHPSRNGEVNVGTGSESYGYNSTSYRVIGGVHDGQLAHDAVTVDQVNSVIDAINTALSTNIPHIGAQS